MMLFINVKHLAILKEKSVNIISLAASSVLFKLPFSAAATQTQVNETFLSDTIEVEIPGNSLSHVPNSSFNLPQLSQHLKCIKTEHGFHNTRYNEFVFSHILAGNGQLKALRKVLRKMVDEEGSGSAPTLCEILHNDFSEWDSTSVVWDMLANVYARLEMVQDALFILDKLKGLKFRPSISTYNSLLYSLRYTDMLWHMYREIECSGVTRSEYTNAILIDGLCKQLRLQEALLFFLEVGKNAKLCIVSLNTLMSGLCNAGFVDVAKSLNCMMLKYGVLPDAYSFNTLMHGLCTIGSMNEAIELFENMKKHGVKPDLVSYNTLVNGYRLLGVMNKAWEVLRKMIKEGLNPDVITYTTLICGYCQRGDIKEGLGLCDKMLSQGFQLGMATYLVLLVSLFKTGYVDAAVWLIDNMEDIRFEREMHSKKITPNTIVNGAILSGFCKKGMLLEARAYFEILLKNGLLADIVLYNIMIDGYVKQGDMSQAVQLYEEIFKVGMTPNIITFNSLINGYCKSMKLSYAERCLDSLMVHGFVPTAVTYTTLMDAYGQEGNINAMLVLLSKMEAQAVAPTVATFTVLIKALCKQQKMQESMQVLKNMEARGLTPDHITYNTLIDGFCKLRNFEAAYYLCYEMSKYNLQPTPVTYNVIIKGLCLYGDLRVADRYFENALEDRSIRLTKTAYTTIIKAHCVKGDACKAIGLFKQMVKKEYDISIRDYSAVINRLCKRGLIDEVKMFHQMMLDDGIYPDQPMLEVLINAYKL